MSLDVSLYRKYHVSYDGGKTLEGKVELVYDANITHNLVEMADKAGIYEALWRPHRLKSNYDIPENDHNSEWEFECKNPTKAFEIIETVEYGLDRLKSNPEFFKQFNSSNGWGMYEHFVPFVEKYLQALKDFPESTVEISR